MEIYEIMYDYTDDGGYECRNCIETYEGSWDSLRDYIKGMRRHGCYNITATLINSDDAE